MSDERDDTLCHYGTPRHSGRYPWGSGKKPQRSKDLLGREKELRDQGLSEVEIAKALGLKNTSELRALKTIAKNTVQAQQLNMIHRLQEKGMSNVAIGKRLGINESQVRALLKAEAQGRKGTLDNTADILRESLKENKYVDVGKGVSRYLGVSDQTLKVACDMLAEEGYERKDFHIQQVTTGKYTDVKVLCPAGTTAKELHEHLTEINMPNGYLTDHGGEIHMIHRPVQFDHEKVMVRYATDDENSGQLKDGVIELRRGVPELDMGNSRYAQVRIALDSGHYLKGMAVYNDNLPEGVDILFNSNKKEGTPLGKVFKEQKPDPDHPFGSAIDRQNDWVDDDGTVHQGALNIVREEGAWGQWKKSIASQVLSKQTVDLAKRQLNLAASEKKEEFEEIMALTNPVIKKKLLEDFADQCDSDAVELKAAALPRQASHVILPVNSLTEKEIYAPNYNDGEEVVLIRYPHGGIFEVPRLRVNNKNKEAREVIGNAVDAVGINAKTAEVLSGADFDGDSVLVIPTKGINFKTREPFEELKGFDPKAAYPKYEGMKPMTKQQRGQEMGSVTNLICDMTLKGASEEDLIRAVRHSMVVIDAYKHELDYKSSYIDNGIAELKERYQGSARAGASTLISKASSRAEVPVRKDQYKIDPETGKKVWTYTGETKTKVETDEAGNKTYITTDKPKTQTSTKMYETEDAFTLSSGHPMETVYAQYANTMKALGNEARKASLSTGKQEYSPSAYQTYKPEVDSLKAKLNEAIKNAPRERKAQMVANSVIKAKAEANPSIREDADEYKKIKDQELKNARLKYGASKDYIKPTEREWEAIQAGAVHQATLESIIDNADSDVIRKLATPRAQVTMTAAKIASAKAMLDAGFTTKEVADRYGVSTSTINKYVRGE